MRLTVTTVRNKLTKPQVDKFVSDYLDNPRISARLDIDRFCKTGQSITKVVEHGMEIETRINLEKD